MARGDKVIPREEGAADLAQPSRCHTKARCCGAVPPCAHPLRQRQPCPMFCRDRCCAPAHDAEITFSSFPWLRKDAFSSLPFQKDIFLRSLRKQRKKETKEKRSFEVAPSDSCRDMLLVSTFFMHIRSWCHFTPAPRLFLNDT